MNPLPTELTYYEDPYLKTMQAKIVGVERAEKRINVFLDRTIFFPSGGGQPCDQGVIATKLADFEVRNVQMNDGIVRHECELRGEMIEEGDEVNLTINWERRYKNMKTHSAGHIIHDVLMSKVTNLFPVRGDHGSKPFIEYKPAIELSEDFSQELELETNKLIKEGRQVITRETTLDELKKIAQFVPENLPIHKALRIIQIDGFPAMPDGGTQVQNLVEIGPVEIVSLMVKNDRTILSYRLTNS